MNDLRFSAYLSSVSFSTPEIAGRDLTLVDPVEGSEQGRLDLGDLNRRARRLLESTTGGDEGERLF